MFPNQEESRLLARLTLPNRPLRHGGNARFDWRASWQSPVNDAVAVNAVAAGSVDDPAPPEVQPDALNLQLSTFLANRLRAALFDLCVRVPGAWITATPKGIDFERLTIRQCDRLVRSLEDAARALEDSGPDRHCVRPIHYNSHSSTADL